MRLNTKINYEASGRGLFLCAVWVSFLCAVFLGGRVYKRGGNDMREVEMI